MKQIIKIIAFSTLSFFTINHTQAQCSSEVRVALGGVTALMLYNTYIAVGSIGDMYTSEILTASNAKVMANEQSEMIQTVYEQVQGAQSDKSNSLTKDDKAYLKEVLSALNYLKLQAAALERYIGNGSETDLNTYSKNRENAWAKIEVLLGIK